MDKPPEAVNSLDSADALGPLLGQAGDWELEVDAAVRAFAVVVLDKLPEHPVEVAFSTDEHPVQALGSGCADKAFGESVRPGRPDGGLDDLGADRAHYLVEGPDELGVPVTNNDANGSPVVLQGGGQVTGLLGDPGPDGVGCHAGQENLRSLDLDEKQDITPPERDRVDMEEVARKGAGGLRPDEL